MYNGRQQGQAISEFLVSMLWMVPVVLSFVAIAHMLNVQSTAHEAARYVAWERLAYGGEQYNQKLSAGGVNGFGVEVTQRFFVNGSQGFGDGNGGQLEPQWQDWQSKQSIVDTAQGAKLELGLGSSEVQTNQLEISSLLKYRSGKSSWMEGRGVELDTSSVAELSIPIRVEGNAVYRLEGIYDRFDTEGVSAPRIKSSYALISDSWAAGSEQNFHDAVEEVVPDGLTSSRLWLQNNGGARMFRNHFAEVDQKLFSDPDSTANSLSTISPEQSTALPATLLEDYIEP